MDNQTPKDIKELISKALKGQISKEENELLDLWYDKALPQEVLWGGPEKDSDELKTKIFSQINRKIDGPSIKLPFYKSTWFRMAAGILLVFGAVLYLINGNKSAQEQLVAENGNGVKKIMLPDHSIVWLKGNSTLSYPKQFDDSIRNVELTGEALFEVAKDKNHPFVVKTGNYVTRVLGTSFNLDTKQKSYKLIVLTGKVQVNEIDPVNKTQKVLAVVSPNQRFNKKELMSGTLVAPKDTEKAAVVSGTEYLMDFNHTPFSIIMRRIENKFAVNFAKSDYTNYLDCRITADLTDQSLKSSMDILTTSIGATYKIEDNIILIGGGGCR